mmetsp:Transcript_23937/g.55845  ORF Transcript_23937/g.55845 Transcript_23937/m.55845 type:complete len:349 (-) Transcript_23937:142-1188(-)
MNSNSPSGEPAGSSEGYESEKRRLECEQKLLDIEARRLELEQKKVELELERLKLKKHSKSEKKTRGRSAPSGKRRSSYQSAREEEDEENGDDILDSNHSRATSILTMEPMNDEFHSSFDTVNEENQFDIEEEEEEDGDGGERNHHKKKKERKSKRTGERDSMHSKNSGKWSSESRNSLEKKLDDIGGLKKKMTRRGSAPQIAGSSMVTDTPSSKKHHRSGLGHHHKQRSMRDLGGTSGERKTRRSGMSAHHKAQSMRHLEGVVVSHSSIPKRSLGRSTRSASRVVDEDGGKTSSKADDILSPKSKKSGSHKKSKKKSSRPPNEAIIIGDTPDSPIDTADDTVESLLWD